MFRAASAAAVVLVGGHAGATLVSMNPGLLGTTSIGDGDSDNVLLAVGGGDGATVPTAQQKTLALLAAQLYRGQHRQAARVAALYCDDCTFETPMLALRGPEQVARFARRLPALRPVQLGYREECFGPRHMRLHFTTEVTMLGRSYLVPSTVALTLDESGARVVRHEETWHNTALVNALASTRQLNGLLFGLLPAPASK